LRIEPLLNARVCDGPFKINVVLMRGRLNVAGARVAALLSMQHVLIIHEVADYVAWKRVFDGAAGIRREAGERTYQVLRYEMQPDKIVHFSAWTSHRAAKAFFESPRLVAIRKEAGVKAPEFIYLEELENGTL
jgi:quinol monooxygenase YgiN